MRLLIVQRILPTYRADFFAFLSRSSAFSVTVACGEPHQGTALRGAAGDSRFVRKVVRNLTLVIGGREVLIYQLGVFHVVHDVAPDVIVAEFNTRILSNLVLWAYTRVRRVPLIWWGHGFGRSGGPISRRARLFLAARSEGLILYAETQRGHFVREGIDPRKLFVARNTLDTERIFALSHPWGDARRFRIIVIGRLLKVKKVDVVLRAFAVCRQRLPAHVLLTVIGEGPERARLEAFATELAIAGHVEFAGGQYDEAIIARYFNEAWCSVSAGGVGLGVIHSFAYGVPMLVARTERHGPEIEAVVDGVNGVLFDSDDAAALAAKLAALAEDPDLLDELSHGARQTVASRYRLGNMVYAFEQAVDGAL